ncbi:U-box domain-containing protein 35 [Vitis vinifera]|uniref:RING-type E3 ubiquitin transferase n=1 Tax=Vitis vinifera TaxID=29760 RepID=A0A438HNZ2_VITVI|nr:U-box domain-containing protein 35 [Vitis vinifera]
MEAKEIIEEKQELALALPLPSTIAVAINGKKKANMLLVGNSIPLSQVRDDVAEAYLEEMGWQTSEMLLPYKTMFLHKKVQVDVVVIESDDVAKAIAEEIAKSTIHKLVIGASSSGMFSRKVKGQSLSLRISECTPSFCTVYTVSKGQLSSVRPSDSDKMEALKRTVVTQVLPPVLQVTLPAHMQVFCGFIFSFSFSFTTNATLSSSFNYNRTLLHTRTGSIETNSSRRQSLDIREEESFMSPCPSNSDIGYAPSQVSSARSFLTDDQSWISDQASSSDALQSPRQEVREFLVGN